MTRLPSREVAMEYTYQDLKKKTVAELREIAKEIESEAVRGYTTMHKEQLLLAICKALDIDTKEHHEVVGIDKTAVKAKIRALKAERDKAEQEHDHARLKRLRRQIRHWKREIRKAVR
ncbi:MAG: hypothetical protein D6718_07725 [Acidobacteria bacterium]|nr:MAG: hypothetical protein D6718_07725 [Acidobacteriota bacterium]